MCVDIHIEIYVPPLQPYKFKRTAISDTVKALRSFVSGCSSRLGWWMFHTSRGPWARCWWREELLRRQRTPGWTAATAFGGPRVIFGFPGPDVRKCFWAFFFWEGIRETSNLKHPLPGLYPWCTCDGEKLLQLGRLVSGSCDSNVCHRWVQIKSHGMVSVFHCVIWNPWV